MGNTARSRRRFRRVLPPPPVRGSATPVASSCRCRTAPARATQELQAATQTLPGRRRARRRSSQALFTSLPVNAPQLYANVDRTKAKQQDVPVTDVFDTLQVYLGSLYVNDFNHLGRTYRVRVTGGRRVPRARGRHRPASRRATAPARWCPLRRLVKVKDSYRAGPHQSLQPLSFGRHQRQRRARFSSGQALAAMERLAAETLPQGIGFEWTDWPFRRSPPATPRSLHLPAVRAVRVAGARCAVRELAAATRDHPDRAHVPARRR